MTDKEAARQGLNCRRVLAAIGSSVQHLTSYICKHLDIRRGMSIISEWCCTSNGPHCSNADSALKADGALGGSSLLKKQLFCSALVSASREGNGENDMERSKSMYMGTYQQMRNPCSVCGPEQAIRMSCFATQDGFAPQRFLSCSPSTSNRNWRQDTCACRRLLHQ